MLEEIIKKWNKEKKEEKKTWRDGLTFEEWIAAHPEEYQRMFQEEEMKELERINADLLKRGRIGKPYDTWEEFRKDNCHRVTEEERREWVSKEKGENVR